MVEPDPENSIRMLQSGTGGGSERDLQLVAENEVLKGNLAPRTEAGKQTAEQQDAEIEHPAG
jgi:hypothetical protein